MNISLQDWELQNLEAPEVVQKEALVVQDQVKMEWLLEYMAAAFIIQIKMLKIKLLLPLKVLLYYHRHEKW